MITAPTGTSPTSRAFCAWSSAIRIANSSAALIASRLLFGRAVGALLQRAVGRVLELLLDVLRLLRHRQARGVGRRRAGHAAGDRGRRAVAGAELRITGRRGPPRGRAAPQGR